MRPQTLQRAAHHEAGHAVAFAFAGVEYHIEGISLEPVAGTERNLDSAARVNVAPAVRPMDLLGSSCRPQAEKALIIFLAGPAAERAYLDKPRMESLFQTEIAFHQLNQLIAAHADGCYTEYLKWLQARAAQLVSFHWNAVTRLAMALIEKKRLSGDAVYQITPLFWMVEGHCRGLAAPARPLNQSEKRCIQRK
jgi:hypothetical protein